jgi:hypothetical protein
MCSEVTAHEQVWLQVAKILQTSYKIIVTKYPDADDVLQQEYKVLGDLVSLACCTAASVGESEKWVRTVDAAENDKASLVKILKGKSLYTAVYGTYTVTLKELKAILEGSATKNISQQATATPKDRLQWKRMNTGSMNKYVGSGTTLQKMKLLKEETRNLLLMLTA